ncbi:2200_t:CDS:2 [Paraglomus occultum]|uniref:2200_t:CDS:1 n=1 Tax=Paraglomus occultum TaxID=144539 RepID=A0A9N9AMB5_9GLOM|nr:2200_t:CDS:2 [Paraglomus occultum]
MADITYVLRFSGIATIVDVSDGKTPRKCLSKKVDKSSENDVFRSDDPDELLEFKHDELEELEQQITISSLDENIGLANQTFGGTLSDWGIHYINENPGCTNTKEEAHRNLGVELDILFNELPKKSRPYTKVVT